MARKKIHETHAEQPVTGDSESLREADQRRFYEEQREKERAESPPQPVASAIEQVISQAAQAAAIDFDPAKLEQPVPAAPPAREPGDDTATEPTNGHAERKFPPHRPWAHNNSAGVELSSYSSKEKKIYEMQLRFRDGKPSQEVREYMKDNGFRWESAAPKGGIYEVEGAWVHPIGYSTGAQDRLAGERVYAGVVNMILQEKGLAPEPGRIPD